MKPRGPVSKDDLRKISVDVAAYNDVVIHLVKEPRPLDRFRAGFEDYPWNDGSVSEETWTEMHADYVKFFRKYERDPEAIAYRDQRQRQMSEAAKRAARKAAR